MYACSADKVLVSIIPGLSPADFLEAVTALQNAVASKPLLDIVVSSYRAVDDGGNAANFNTLSQVRIIIPYSGKFSFIFVIRP